MGNRHYYGGDRGSDGPEPTVGSSGGRLAFTWMVTIAFVLTVGPALGDKAHAFVYFILFFPIIALLMLVVTIMGAIVLVNGFRGIGPGPGNLLFWLEGMPAAIGILVGLMFLSRLSEPW